MKRPCSGWRVWSASVLELARGARAAAPWVEPDELWEWIQPLSQVGPAFPLSRSDAAARSGSAAGDPVCAAHVDRVAAAPAELGFGTGVTCWRRLDEWQRAGVDATARAAPLACALRVSWNGRGRSSIRARSKRTREPETGPELGRQGPAGSKHHLLTDAHGTPLAWARREQPQRHHPTAAAARRRPRGDWPARSATATTRAAPQRRRLLLQRDRQALRERGITHLLANRYRATAPASAPTAGCRAPSAGSTE